MDPALIAAGWEKKKAAGNRDYYVNHLARTTTWSRPDVSSAHDTGMGGDDAPAGQFLQPARRTTHPWELPSVDLWTSDRQHVQEAWHTDETDDDLQMLVRKINPPVKSPEY